MLMIAVLRSTISGHRYSEKEAFALVSMDLGHGDGRENYIKIYSL